MATQARGRLPLSVSVEAATGDRAESRSDRAWRLFGSIPSNQEDCPVCALQRAKEQKVQIKIKLPASKSPLLFVDNVDPIHTVVAALADVKAKGGGIPGTTHRFSCREKESVTLSLELDKIRISRGGRWTRSWGDGRWARRSGGATTCMGSARVSRETRDGRWGHRPWRGPRFSRGGRANSRFCTDVLSCGCEGEDSPWGSGGATARSAAEAHSKGTRLSPEPV